MHHRQRSRPRPHDANLRRKSLDEQILAVAVRIHHEDLGGAAFLCGFDGGNRFGGHELAEALVLESGGPELVGRHGAGDAFHIYGDENLEGPRLGSSRRGGERHGEEEYAHAKVCSGSELSGTPRHRDGCVLQAVRLSQPAKRIGDACSAVAFARCAVAAGEDAKTWGNFLLAPSKTFVETAQYGAPIEQIIKTNCGRG